MERVWVSCCLYDVKMILVVGGNDMIVFDVQFTDMLVGYAILINVLQLNICSA
jgi:hypothetical protein